MPHLYRITRLDRFTRGIHNRKLKTWKRSPGYFERATCPLEAADKFLARLPDGNEAIEVHLVQKNGPPLF